LGWVGCGGDAPVPNTPPTATILSPADQLEVPEGTAITFQGQGTDAEDGELEPGALVWTSSEVGQIGTGRSFQQVLPVGQHRITLTVTDSRRATGLATVTVTVLGPNQPPTARITAPTNGSTFAFGQNVMFVGLGTDPEDGTLPGSSLAWTSDRDGPLGSGSTLITNGLTAGTHTVTLTVTDRRGATGAATITLTVSSSNTAPRATITAPEDQATFTEGERVTFSGTGTDAEDGELTGEALSWSSDQDGLLGTGESLTVTSLSVGTHRITFTATDQEGATGTALITITVQSAAPNTPPTAEIRLPPPNASFTEGQSVTFSGTGTDAEDGTLDGQALAWTSNLDGFLGQGSYFALNHLSVGMHLITLTATDSRGATGTDTVTITVQSTGPTGGITIIVD